MFAAFYPPRLKLLSLFIAGLLVVVGGLSPAMGAPARPGGVRITASGDGAVAAAVGVAVRVEGESDREALRIAAFMNDALRRAGLRPDALARAQLHLKFEHPETLSVGHKPGISVVGRGGSSSHAEFGLEIQLPAEGAEAPVPPAPHSLLARLERGPGEVVWQATAETDAVPGKETAAVIRTLTAAIAGALAKAAKPGSKAAKPG